MFKEKLLKRAVASYAGEHVLKRILENGEDALKLGAQVINLTIYFQDIVGFTAVSEDLSPEKVVHLLNDYLTIMTDTIEGHNGIVDKYIGDAIIAFWGAYGEPNHPDSACACALAALHQASLVSERFGSDGAQPLRLTVGINTGKVLLGNFGSPNRFQYTILGDAVNLASRLERANKHYGTDILLSEFTKKELSDQSNVIEVDSIQVKGITSPVRLYTLQPASSQPDNPADGFRRR